MVRRPRTLAILFAAATLAVAGCGDDEDERGNLNVEGATDTAGGGRTAAETTGTTGTTPEEPTGTPIATIGVRETEFELDPQNPRVARPGVVEFRARNAGDVIHALEVEGPGGERETDEIAPGASATLKVDLDRPGRYKWYCPVGDHESRGMAGVITVARGGAGRDDDDRTGTNGGSGRGGDDDRGGSGRGRGGDDDRGGGDRGGGSGGGY